MMTLTSEQIALLSPANKAGYLLKKAQEAEINGRKLAKYYREVADAQEGTAKTLSVRTACVVEEMTTAYKALVSFYEEVKRDELSLDIAEKSKGYIKADALCIINEVATQMSVILFEKLFIDENGVVNLNKQI